MPRPCGGAGAASGRRRRFCRLTCSPLRPARLLAALQALLALAAPAMHQCQRAQAIGCRPPARLAPLHPGQAARRAPWGISAAPAGRPPRRWVATAADDAAPAGAAQAHPDERGEQASQPPPQGVSWLSSACAAVAQAFSALPGMPGQVCGLVGLAAAQTQHSTLQSCRAFVHRFTNPSPLWCCRHCAQGRAASAQAGNPALSRPQPPAPALSVSRRELEELRHRAHWREYNEEEQKAFEKRQERWGEIIKGLRRAKEERERRAA